jgi:hypothetical protein
MQLHHLKKTRIILIELIKNLFIFVLNLLNIEHYEKNNYVIRFCFIV